MQYKMCHGSAGQLKPQMQGDTQLSDSFKLVEGTSQPQQGCCELPVHVKAPLHKAKDLSDTCQPDPSRELPAAMSAQRLTGNEGAQPLIVCQSFPDHLQRCRDLHTGIEAPAVAVAPVYDHRDCGARAACRDAQMVEASYVCGQLVLHPEVGHDCTAGESRQASPARYRELRASHCQAHHCLQQSCLAGPTCCVQHDAFAGVAAALCGAPAMCRSKR